MQQVLMEKLPPPAWFASIYDREGSPAAHAAGATAWGTDREGARGVVTTGRLRWTCIGLQMHQFKSSKHETSKEHLGRGMVAK